MYLYNSNRKLFFLNFIGIAYVTFLCVCKKKGGEISSYRGERGKERESGSRELALYEVFNGILLVPKI